MTVETFAVRVDPAVRPLFRLLGIGPRRSGVEVGPDRVRVRTSWWSG